MQQYLLRRSYSASQGQLVSKLQSPALKLKASYLVPANKVISSQCTSAEGFKYHTYNVTVSLLLTYSGVVFYLLGLLASISHDVYKIYINIYCVNHCADEGQEGRGGLQWGTGVPRQTQFYR